MCLFDDSGDGAFTESLLLLFLLVFVVYATGSFARFLLALLLFLGRCCLVLTCHGSCLYEMNRVAVELDFMDEDPMPKVGMIHQVSRNSLFYER